VASNHEHHDKLDKAGLAAWFNSIEIEFENVQEQESDAANN
jgi:hypothetical protein